MREKETPEASECVVVGRLPRYAKLTAHHDPASFPCFMVMGIELLRVMSVASCLGSLAFASDTGDDKSSASH